MGANLSISALSIADQYPHSEVFLPFARGFVYEEGDLGSIWRDAWRKPADKELVFFIRSFGVYRVDGAIAARGTCRAVHETPTIV